jgi:hypothetical protein
MPAPLGEIYYDVTGHPLLSDKYNALESADEKLAQQVLAESLLGITSAEYIAADPEYPTICYAVVVQIGYQMERSITPDVMKSVSNTHPGNTTNFRDRYVSPVAWALYSRATGVTTIGFTPPGRGV